MKSLPNLLSIARIILTPFVLRAVWMRQYELALGLLFLAGISDALDGFLARRLRAISRLGAYLDPIADKILLSGLFVTLALDRAIPIWLAVLVLGRDALILLFVAWALRFTKVRSFPPSVWGKLSTIVQIAFVLATLLHQAGLMRPGISEFLLYATAAVTLLSAAHYGGRALARAGLQSRIRRMLNSR